jgi:hypothetical protein
MKSFFDYHSTTTRFAFSASKAIYSNLPERFWCPSCRLSKRGPFLRTSNPRYGFNDDQPGRRSRQSALVNSKSARVSIPTAFKSKNGAAASFPFSKKFASPCSSRGYCCLLFSKSRLHCSAAAALPLEIQ